MLNTSDLNFAIERKVEKKVSDTMITAVGTIGIITTVLCLSLTAASINTSETAVSLSVSPLVIITICRVVYLKTVYRNKLIST